MEQALKEHLELMRANVLASRAAAAVKLTNSDGSNAAAKSAIEACDLRLERIDTYRETAATLCPTCWVQTGKKIHMHPVMSGASEDIDGIEDDNGDLIVMDDNNIYECTLCKTSLNFTE